MAQALSPDAASYTIHKRIYEEVERLYDRGHCPNRLSVILITILYGLFEYLHQTAEHNIPQTGPCLELLRTYETGQDRKIRLPAVTPERRVIVRTEAVRNALGRERLVQHPTKADTIDIASLTT